jgi:hypothetical protein
MLIDLQWDIKYAHGRMRTEFFTEFNTQNGHLITTFEFPPSEAINGERVFRHCVAERIHQGVYWANNLYNDILNYTEWEVEHKWTESHRLIKLMEQAKLKGNDGEWEKQRTLFFRECNKKYYGTADNLKQVFKCGSVFIRSQNPYVLSIFTIDPKKTDLDRYFDKNGGYIGTKKKVWETEEPLIHFNFNKLIPKQQMALAI